jgi:ureidoglycolate lyase
MAKTIQVMELTEENFKEFGQIITTEGKTPDAGDANFNWFEKLSAFEGIQTVSINILECKQREMKLDRLEVHQETNEAIIALGGADVVAAFAPAGKLDESKIKAFRIPGSKGVVFNVGVRHFIPYPLKGDTNCVVIFKHATGANDLVFEQLSEVYEMII